MKSRITSKFRKLFDELPQSVQQQAREVYRQFMREPWHSGLRFKRIHNSLPIYSVRIGKGYREVGIHNENGVVWFWIDS
ncbi:MAG: type II toxin-antitoxin system RelE family toxin [Chlorobium sp.]